MNHEPEVTQTDVMLTKQVKERIESSEIARLKDQITKLRKALEPFAEIGKQIQPALKDDHRIQLMWAIPSAGDFRAAALALEETKE